MKYQQRGARTACVAAVALMAAGAAMAQSTLRGTLAAPQGQDVRGTVIYACDLDLGPECKLDGRAVREFKFNDEHGASTPFSLVLPHNKAGYGLTAWKDNGDGKIGVGDLLGVYFQGGQKLTPVPVPAEGIQLRMVVAGKDQAQPAPPFVAPPVANPSGTAATGQAPGSLGALAGRWQAGGKATEVEYGSEMVRSSFGLPAGQQMGVIGNGNGAQGSYAWGMRNSYKTYEVVREGELAIQPGGAFTWQSATDSKRSADCNRVIEFRMSGTASVQGGLLVLAIADGQQKTYHRGCPGTQISMKTESLAGQTRGYEARLDAGALKIRQVQPVSSISSSAVYQRH